MQIAGLQKLSLIDYDGYISAIIFTRGCPFRCAFCHNPELVIPESYIPLMDNEEVMEYLESRKNKLEAICITGGEPTLQPDLLDFMEKIKKMGFKIKLDSNGFKPEIIKKILDEKRVDYIAMDYKSPISNYTTTTSCNIDTSKIKESVSLIMSSPIPYEFRTTVVKPLHKPDDFLAIGQELKDAKLFYIQNFVKSKHVKYQADFAAFTDSELEESLKNVKKYIPNSYIR